jgi:CelD/BcsL family acetyltransferase involved in cellulose biosynthesis
MVTHFGEPIVAYHIDRVTTRAALDHLRPEWEALWHAMPTRTPFQHPAWLLPWWDVFGAVGHHALRVLAIRDGARLMGIVPLVLSNSNELRLLGGGISDYLDLLARPDAERMVTEALAWELDRAAQADEWQLCAFDALRPSSPLLKMDPPRDVEERRGSEPPCPVLPLDDHRYLGNVIGAKLVADIRYGRRRADRLGGLTVDIARPETVQDMLSRLFALQSERAGGFGVLTDPAVRTFHRMAAPALIDAGLLRLLTLRVGNRVISACYALQAAGHFYWHLGGFDPAFSSLGPGTLALAAVLEVAIAEGASTLDVLAGAEPYKPHWHAVDQPRIRRHFVRPTDN